MFAPNQQLLINSVIFFKKENYTLLKIKKKNQKYT